MGFKFRTPTFFQDVDERLGAGPAVEYEGVGGEPVLNVFQHFLLRNFKLLQPYSYEPNHILSIFQKQLK